MMKFLKNEIKFSFFEYSNSSFIIIYHFYWFGFSELRPNQEPMHEGYGPQDGDVGASCCPH